MAEELPNDFDIIVVGTGLSESILSGALSRIGKKVLHLDQNKYYGSNWSSFNLRAFESWIEETDASDDYRISMDDILQKLDSETEELVFVKNIRKTTEQGKATCYLSNATEETSSKNEGNVVSEKRKIEESSVEEGSTSQEIQVTIPGITAESENIEVEGGKDKIANEDGKSGDNEEILEKVGENAGILKNLAKEDRPKQSIDENTREYFYSKWRHYNLDLAPKLMFSRGKLVELLITSNVCRYLEFRNVTRTLTLLDDGGNTRKLAPVPCSRTDVFNSKFVSMIEKRMLMRVLTMCANYENHPEEYLEFEGKKFFEFLAAKKLSKKLQHFILHSISMVDENTNTMDGLKATQKFLNSLGRYGNSAFLWPLYGVGELPQAFCRLGAVFGGTFCLNRSLHAIVINKINKQCVGIIDSTGQRLQCDQLILDECYVPENHRKEFTNMVSRAIYVTDHSLLQVEKENVSLITIPPMSDLPSSRLLEVGPAGCVCPPKYYVVHAMTSIESTSNDPLPSPQSKFQNMEKMLFRDIDPVSTSAEKQDIKSSEQGQTSETELKVDQLEKPRVIWSAYFNMMSGGVDTDSLSDNVFVTRGPSMDLGFDETVSEARRLFEAICPEEEFLPRAPNPDEIIYFDQDDEGYNTETNGAQNDQLQPQDGREYQEDESEVDAGSGEPPDQVEISGEDPTNSVQSDDVQTETT